MKGIFRQDFFLADSFQIHIQEITGFDYQICHMKEFDSYPVVCRLGYDQLPCNLAYTVLFVLYLFRALFIHHSLLFSLFHKKLMNIKCIK